MFDERTPIFEEEDQEKLLENILAAPDTLIYGVNRFQRSTIKNLQIMTVVVTILSALVGVYFYNPIITEILLLVIISIASVIALILSYLKYSHDYTKTYMSEIGIGKESDWDRGVIPWELLEFIELQFKHEEIDLTIFRSGRKTLAYRKTRFIKQLTLEVISEYIGGIEKWLLINDLSEEVADLVEGHIFYMNPDIDRSEGKKKLEEMILREWIGDQDYDAGETQEHDYSKSDEELYEKILNDPQCECVLDYGRFNRMISNFKVIGVMFIAAIGVIFLGMPSGPLSSILIVSGIVLFILVFYPLFKGYEQLIMSPIGISRYFFGSPEALEWQHVEFIDLRIEDEVHIPYEFFGNKRRIYCPEHIYKQLISMDMIRKYLPELDAWEKKTRSDWSVDVYRLSRPDV